MARISEWSTWLQYVVLLPHAVLGFVMTWLWWPRSPENTRRFAILAAYLLVFYLVMRVVVGF